MLLLEQSVSSQDTRAVLFSQRWKETLAEVAEKLFSPLSLPCYLLIPLEACWHQAWQRVRSLTGNPRQDPYLSRAQ